MTDVKTLFRSDVTMHPVEANVPGSMSKLVGSNGEFNARDKNELINMFKQVASMLESKQIYNPTAAIHDPAKREERRKAIEEARTDDSKWAELGAALASALYTTANREGFARKLLQRQDLAQGNIPRFPVKFKNSIAYVASAAGQVLPTMLRDKYIMPPEFYLETNCWIEERELAQGTGDQLEEKFYEAQEAIQVQEDRYWKKLVDSSVGVSNNLQLLGGGLDPDSLALMKEQITRWNLPALHMLFAVDGLNDLNGTIFGGWFDPVSQYEIVMSGTLGQLSGMTLTTDAYREPMLKVFDRGEMYIVSSPEYNGAYTDRGPIESRNKESQGEGMGPCRGWYLFELISMVVHNARSAVKAVKN